MYMSRPGFHYVVIYLVVLFIIIHVWQLNFSYIPRLSNTGTNSSVDDQTSSAAIMNQYLVQSEPLEMINESHWAPKLQDMLSKMKFQDEGLSSQHFSHKQITVVISDAEYVLSLLNWLVAALIRTSPPIENVIVISFDETLQALMDEKEIRSVYVNPETITNGRIHGTAHIWIARCAIYRLLNHWGYDVMVYDTDAIVLRNLQDILRAHTDSDVVASSGFYPYELEFKWGWTLCMGVALFRSTRRTGEGWYDNVHNVLSSYN